MGSQVCAQVKAPSPPACLATTAPRDTPLHGRLPPSSLSKNFPSLKPGFVWLVGFQYESFSTYSSENSVLALGSPRRPSAPGPQPQQSSAFCQAGSLLSPPEDAVAHTHWPARQQDLQVDSAAESCFALLNDKGLLQKDALTLRPPVLRPPPPSTRLGLQDRASEEEEIQGDVEKVKGVGLEENNMFISCFITL